MASRHDFVRDVAVAAAGLLLSVLGTPALTEANRMAILGGTAAALLGIALSVPAA